jgi:hypothetical protein
MDLVAELDEFGNDPRHHDARRRSVGCEVRAQHRDSQPVGAGVEGHVPSRAAV